MSAEATLAPGRSWRVDLPTVRTLRYALGTTVAVGIALGIDWRLSYLTPVLILGFLAGPRPPVRALASFFAVVTLASAIGVLAAAVLLPYPAVFLLLEALTLFLLFYHGVRGAPPLVVTWLMIAVTVIPIVALQSMQLAIAVAKGIVVGTAAALALAWLAHLLIPDPTAVDVQGEEPASAPAGSARPSPAVAAGRAWLNTIVVFPVVATYFVLGLTSVLILVFIALLSMQPDFASGFKAGKALIAANVLGGLAAVAMYELLVMVPTFGFLLLLVLLAGLLFGQRLFSGVPAAPLFGMAYSTLLLVIGSTTSAYGDANAKAWTRVVQITIAVVYLVVAFGTLQRLRRKPEINDATS
jgi:hypothetical protein